MISKVADSGKKFTHVWNRKQFNPILALVELSVVTFWIYLELLLWMKDTTAKGSLIVKSPVKYSEATFYSRKRRLVCGSTNILGIFFASISKICIYHLFWNLFFLIIFPDCNTKPHGSNQMQQKLRDGLNYRLFSSDLFLSNYSPLQSLIPKDRRNLPSKNFTIFKTGFGIAVESITQFQGKWDDRKSYGFVFLSPFETIVIELQSSQLRRETWKY